jgi:hypothetical protein
MSYHQHIINELDLNRKVYEGLLQDVPKEMISWKDDPKRWTLLEIVCHLHDEEKEDFRARLRSVIVDPTKALTAIDPQGWVKNRDYASQDYDLMLFKFLKQRKISIEWLNSLKDPKWKNFIVHKSLGEMSAELFLSNWLAHDHLHFRQIIKLKFDYLTHLSDQDLSYAGDW